MISSGLRETIRYLAQHNMVSIISTDKIILAYHYLTVYEKILIIMFTTLYDNVCNDINVCWDVYALTTWYVSIMSQGFHYYCGHFVQPGKADFENVLRGMGV